MTQLESLSLKGTLVDDLSLVRCLTGLRILNLSQTPMTDAGLADLEGFSELSILDLSATRVTDAGLEHLRGLNKLRTLRLDRTQVSNQAIADLQRALPSLTVPPARKLSPPRKRTPAQ